MRSHGVVALCLFSLAGLTIASEVPIAVNYDLETVTEMTSTEDITNGENTNETAADIVDATTEATVDENVQTSESVVETTPNVVEDVTVIDLDAGYFDTKIGAVHTVKIPEYDFLQNEKCLLVSPDGEQHDTKNLYINGIEVIDDYDVACGIKLHILSEDIVGTWMLIARGTRFSTEIVERRLPIIIYLQEIVSALPQELSVLEGNDIYIRLETPTPLYETCRLLDPAQIERIDVEKDPRHVDTCGFIVRNATKNDSGYWVLTFGTRTIYKAWSHIIINGLGNAVTQTHYTWTLDRPVQQKLGAENTVYCKVVDPNHNVVFDGFGRCNITLPRVTAEHAGTWRLFVGVQGRVITEQHTFEVGVTEGATKPAVSTNVATEKPIVTLTCSVSSPQAVRSCKFRDPSGQILLATPGVGEGRYAFHGSGASYVSGVYGYECGIQITDPITSDLGLWRCALDTEDETYYGFMAALCPWALRDPEVAATVQSEPLLQAESEIVTGVTGTPVTMSCSVQSPIRYCYFRARNGTTFSVSPGDAEYAGAGFDAGECSVRFSTLLSSDNGRWSCHVGFPDPTQPEQRANFELNVQELLAAEQRVEKSALIVTGRVHDNRPLDYCRFVRMDGLGFTTDNLPEGYRSDSLLSVGRCEIRIPNPSILERHPWTVAVRVRGNDVEYSQQTDHSLVVTPPTDPTDPVDPTDPHDPPAGVVVVYQMPVAWIVVIVVGLALIIVGALVGPRRHREWTAARVSRMRNSFSRKPVVNVSVQEKNSPNAA